MQGNSLLHQLLSVLVNSDLKESEHSSLEGNGVDSYQVLKIAGYSNIYSYKILEPRHSCLLRQRMWISLC